jgi:hypothetical protein
VTAAEVALIASGVSGPLLAAISLLFRELLKAERTQCTIWKQLYDTEREDKKALFATNDRLTDSVTELTTVTRDTASAVKTIVSDLRQESRNERRSAKPQN